MLTDHSEAPLMRLLVDRTRREEVRGPALAQVHREIGRLLASDVARSLPLADVAIQHPTGVATGVRIVPGGEPIVLALMRAGLFLAEGVWEALGAASLVPCAAEAAELERVPATDRVVVVVDSVINTGRSIRRWLDALAERRPRQRVVATLVGYRPTMAGLVADYPDVHFVAARLSDRSYVGKATTDTGSRLFGTEQWRLE